MYVAVVQRARTAAALTDADAYGRADIFSSTALSDTEQQHNVCVDNKPAARQHLAENSVRPTNNACVGSTSPGSRLLLPSI